MANTKRANAADFAAQMSKILEEYGEDVSENLEEITKAVGQRGAQQIRTASKNAVGGTGKYAKGWGVTIEKTRTGSTATIHHKTMPGLPHLLEHGHISVVNGRRVGSVAGREHIGPIEQQLIETFEKEVIEKL